MPLWWHRKRSKHPFCLLLSKCCSQHVRGLPSPLEAHPLPCGKNQRLAETSYSGGIAQEHRFQIGLFMPLLRWDSGDRGAEVPSSIRCPAPLLRVGHEHRNPPLLALSPVSTTWYMKMTAMQFYIFITYCIPHYSHLIELSNNFFRCLLKFFFPYIYVVV